ncbi:hypothetical protein [Cryptosporangium japonicum]
MKRWIARIAVPALLLGGAMSIAPPAASAAQWVYGGTYSTQSQCKSIGASRVRSGQYETYRCERDEPFWTLRGFVN